VAVVVVSSLAMLEFKLVDQVAVVMAELVMV